MVRYFFDIDDGVQVVKDTEGSPHIGLAGAHHEAIDTLTQMAREVFPGAEQKSLTVHIRDERGNALMRVALHLSTTSG